MIKTWRLDDLRQTLVLGSREERLAQILYWGPPLPASENLQTLVQADALDLTGGMLDENPALSICPEARRGFPGQAGLVAEDAQGKALLPLFIFESAEETVNALVLTYRDDALQLTYQAQFDIDPETHVISVKASLSSVDPVKLTWFAAPVFPAPQGSQEMTDFAGRWCGEFQMNTTAWSAGIRERENHTGRTGHEHFPGLLVPMKGARNTQGHVYGFHYGWSGGHRMVAEELPDGRRQIQFGHARGIERTPQTRFETAVLYASFSDEGSNGRCSPHLKKRHKGLPFQNGSVGFVQSRAHVQTGSGGAHQAILRPKNCLMGAARSSLDMRAGLNEPHRPVLKRQSFMPLFQMRGATAVAPLI